MSETDTIDTPDELTMLKQRARMMGITFSNNIGVEALRAKIQAKMDGDTQPGEEGTPQSASEQPNPLSGGTGDTAPKKKRLSLRDYLIREEMKLVRLRITNLDPKKKDLHGEIFTVANEHLGTVRKFVPYGEVTDDGYHVPYIIYRELEARRFLNVRTRRGPNNTPIVEQTWAKEFALEVLPPLTKEELARLATAQAAAGVFSED